MTDTSLSRQPVFDMEYQQEQSRLTTFFRFLTAIPGLLRPDALVDRAVDHRADLLVRAAVHRPLPARALRLQRVIRALRDVRVLVLLPRDRPLAGLLRRAGRRLPGAPAARRAAARSTAG